MTQLKVLDGLKSNGLIQALLNYYGRTDGENRYALLSEIYRAGIEENVTAGVQNIILRDENIFSVTCAKGKTPSRYLKKALADDLKTLAKALSTADGGDDFEKGGAIKLFEGDDPIATVNALQSFYSKNGFGGFIDGKAFEYADGLFVPLGNTDPVRLADLKNYGEEKKLISNNIRDFLDGLPYSHTLLYGERGTGKSSTVHAMLNEFYGKGLRLVELNGDNLCEIKTIKRRLAELPLKFILFIDDIALEENDAGVSSLKASVEGSVVAGDNVMIVATTNRRHIVKESFTERDASVHSSDAIEEQLSLSDRFGLSVLFSSTDRQSYLSIVGQLARDRRLTTDTDTLYALAEKWAVVNGGRSPRKAKQFTDFVYSCEQSGREVEF